MYCFDPHHLKVYLVTNLKELGTKEMMIVGMFGRLGFFFLIVGNGFELQYIHTLSFSLKFYN